MLLWGYARSELLPRRIRTAREAIRKLALQVVDHVGSATLILLLRHGIRERSRWRQSLHPRLHERLLACSLVVEGCGADEGLRHLDVVRLLLTTHLLILLQLLLLLNLLLLLLGH